MNEIILIVDDEKKMVNLIRTCLQQEGYRALVAYDGQEALEVFSREAPDLVVLDVMMPRLDGLGFCRRVRETSQTPIIILSAKSEEDDRLVGLELGADDYVTKPFSMRELVARIRAILRRRDEAGSGREKTLVLGSLVMSEHEHRVEVRGRAVALTPTEFKILLVLAGDPGTVFPRADLVQAAQGEYFEGYERTVDAHVGNIRKKISESAGGWNAIDTVYGVGYRFHFEEET
ncbi:MAG: response regulator transcription factor [Candidatus Geothermincolia bacterium]